MMDIDDLRNYCLSLNGVTEDFPFDETTLVFRVGGKIFVLTDTADIPFHFNLKCDPERAIDLRERYDFITAGYHMNKTHWNTIVADSRKNNEFYFELVKHSYDLIFASLKKSIRDSIK